MQQIRLGLLVIFLLLVQGGGAASESGVSRDKASDLVARYLSRAKKADNHSIQMVTRGYDQLGDYAEAVRWAKLGAEFGSEYCTLYYAEALLKGRGIQKDEHKALEQFASLVNDRRTSRLTLARLYADGFGTARDAVEAYALATLAHYEPCKECKEMHDEAGALLKRLRRELTPQQFKVAMERAYAKNPDLKNAEWLETALALTVLLGFTACAWFVVSKTYRRIVTGPPKPVA